LDAARKLFEERGYAGATIDAIAQEAKVAQETVYSVFRNKRFILASLVSVAVGGDDEPIPILQRPGPQEVLKEFDPIRQLRMFAQDISGILGRVAPVFEVMRNAARTEPEIADLLAHLLEERLQNMEKFVRVIAAHTTFRESLSITQATELVWTLTSPEVYRLLTQDRGWSRDQYSSWLGDCLIRLLLP